MSVKFLKSDFSLIEPAVEFFGYFFGLLLCFQNEFGSQRACIEEQGSRHVDGRLLCPEPVRRQSG
jgi:hypothetical protein